MSEGSSQVQPSNTFFALLPPPGLVTALADLRDELAKNLPPNVRAIDPENYHLTLAFVGATHPSKTACLQELARKLAFPKSQLSLNRIGTFPGARVGWVGPQRVDPALLRFQKLLVANLLEAGFTPDTRAWTPHVTVFRKLTSGFLERLLELPYWKIDHFVLLRTFPRSGGVRYEQCGLWPARDLPGTHEG